jgi:hypothetical protein
MNFKDMLIRRFARSWLLKKVDGKKKEIGRVCLGVQMVIIALGNLFPESALIAEVYSWTNEGLLILAWLGLEFGIEDEEIKRRLGDKK